MLKIVFYWLIIITGMNVNKVANMGKGTGEEQELGENHHKYTILMQSLPKYNFTASSIKAAQSHLHLPIITMLNSH